LGSSARTAIIPELVIVNENETKKNSCIIVEGGRITKVDDAAKYREYGPEFVIKEEHLAASPSFVNAHTHGSERLLSGLGDGYSLVEWLEKVVWPACKDVDSDEAYNIGRLFASESIASGIGLFNDMFVDTGQTLFMDGLAKSYADSGVRALVGRGVAEKAGNAETAIKDSLGAAKNWHGHEGRIFITIAPSLIHANSEGMLVRLRELASKEKMRIHIHVAEVMSEYRFMKQIHGLTSVGYLDKIGFLGKDVMAAHLVWLGDGDIGILRRRGVSGLYNPLSNARLGDGIPPVCAMAESGMNIGIGTDGSASSDNQDMFAAMRCASFLPRAFYSDGAVLTTNNVFAMATRLGSKALGIRGGELKEEMPADIVLVDMRNPSLYPVNDIVAQIVLSAHPGVVRGTIVDGKVLYYGGEFKTLDWRNLVSKIDGIVARKGVAK